eukprot:Skav218671  [mRNA]  locus=scaffold44:10772:12310:- [translate_table: standard]
MSSALAVRGPGFPEDPPRKVNYRAIGRGNGGVVKKRTPIFIKDVDPATPSSVPTKYQTVLYRNNREQKGFANQAPRFAASRDDKTPGPGRYTGDEPLDGGAPESRRGKGPFASRTPRLPHPSKLHGYVPPGPGSYATAASALDVKDSSPSASFALPGAGNPAKYFLEAEPGPGSYTAALPCGRSGTVFGSSPRNTMVDHIDLSFPGPGQYDHVDAEERMRSIERPSPKHLVHEPLDTEGAQLRRGAELLKDRERSSSPGPGQYYPQLDVVKGRTHFSARGHSSFQIGNSHRPRRWRGDVPGPTDYRPAVSQPTAAPLSTLVSKTERFSKLSPRAPGPAYYVPKKPQGQTSFHLNMDGTWVS